MNRALIVKKHWLDLILEGKKSWEMRSNPTSIRGWIGLIEQGTGLIVGRAYLSCGDHKYTVNELVNYHHKHLVDDDSLLKKWCYAWELENPERFEAPIPYSHPKGAVIWVKI